jgi:predicted hotdog family 3-hydroxylacyl-ACP dehydratase
VSEFPKVATLVPHAGAMCLLERIDDADGDSIICRAVSHMSPNNPLRLNGRLAALHLAEYGAQAMAAHGGWLQQREQVQAAPRAGVLVAIRDLALEVDRLDNLAGELLLYARRLVSTGAGQIYEFRAEAEGRVLGRGRVQVLFADQ